MKTFLYSLPLALLNVAGVGPASSAPIEPMVRQDYVTACFNQWTNIEAGTFGSGHGNDEDSLAGAATFAVPNLTWPAEADAGIALLRSRLKAGGWKVGELDGSVPVSATVVTKMMFDATRDADKIFTVITIIPRREGVVTVVWNQSHWEKKPNKAQGQPADG